MTFKEQLSADLGVFINLEEFGEKHTINNVSKAIVTDIDKLEKLKSTDFQGTIIGEILYYIKTSDYPGTKAPKIGDAQLFDNKQCQISNVKLDDGMYEIILSQVGV